MRFWIVYVRIMQSLEKSIYSISFVLYVLRRYNISELIRLLKLVTHVLFLLDSGFEHRLVCKVVVNPV